MPCRYTTVATIATVLRNSVWKHGVVQLGVIEAFMRDQRNGAKMTSTAFRLLNRSGDPGRSVLRAPPCSYNAA